MVGPGRKFLQQTLGLQKGQKCRTHVWYRALDFNQDVCLLAGFRAG